jgi:hypothetical protein
MEAAHQRSPRIHRSSLRIIPVSNNSSGRDIFWKATFFRTQHSLECTPRDRGFLHGHAIQSPLLFAFRPEATIFPLPAYIRSIRAAQQTGYPVTRFRTEFPAEVFSTFILGPDERRSHPHELNKTSVCLCNPQKGRGTVVSTRKSWEDHKSGCRSLWDSSVRSPDDSPQRDRILLAG